MSKFTTVTYLDILPRHNNNEEKSNILKFFNQGVNAVGDMGILHKGFNCIPCDVACIVGYVHKDGKQKNGKHLPHLDLRQRIIDYQKRSGKKTLIVDSNLFLYADPTNPLHYLRYSFDGVFPTTGFYFDKEIDPNRWNIISRDLNIRLKNYRQTGSHILFCLQRNGGWSMGGYDVISWMTDTIAKIRTYTNRHIIVRAHPGDKKISKILKINLSNVSLSTNKLLTQDLNNCWATVVYNSSPSVASLIEGIPNFVTDPNPRNSQAFGVVNTDLALIENPILFERQEWLNKLCMCHWKFDEMKNGTAWNFFKKHL